MVTGLLGLLNYLANWKKTFLGYLVTWQFGGKNNLFTWLREDLATTAYEKIQHKKKVTTKQVERIKTTLGCMQLPEEISLKKEFLTTKEDF